jgi:hypothetical protein
MRHRCVYVDYPFHEWRRTTTVVEIYRGTKAEDEQAHAVNKMKSSTLKYSRTIMWARYENYKNSPYVVSINYKNMQIRLTSADDWQKLKSIRLASLKESPDTFGWSYALAAKLTDDEWKERASGLSYPKFFLAFENEKPVGIKSIANGCARK